MLGSLKLQVLRATRLRDTAFFGVQDPFVVVRRERERRVEPEPEKPAVSRVKGGDISSEAEFCGKQKKSKTCRDGGVTPEWNELLEFDVGANPHEELTLVVKNKGLVRNDWIGAGTVDLKEVLQGGKHELSVQLFTKDERDAGKLIIAVLYECAEQQTEDVEVKVVSHRKRDLSLLVEQRSKSDVGGAIYPPPIFGAGSPLPRTSLDQRIPSPPQSPYLQVPAYICGEQMSYPSVPESPPPKFPSKSLGSIVYSAVDIEGELTSTAPEVLNDANPPPGEHPPGALGVELPGEGVPDILGAALSNPESPSLQERFQALQPPASRFPVISYQNPDSEEIKDDELLV